MLGIDRALQQFILPARLCMMAQIRTKRQVSLNVRIIGLIEVQVVSSIAIAVLREEPSARETIFAPGYITCFLKLGRPLIQANNTLNQRQQINDGLGGQ